MEAGYIVDPTSDMTYKGKKGGSITPYGLISDIVLAIIGGSVGSFLFDLFGLSASGLLDQSSSQFLAQLF